LPVIPDTKKAFKEKKMNIYVGNISRESSENEIRQAFEEYGEVTSVKLIKDKFTGVSKGFAFVEMTKDEEANNAIKNLDGSRLNGRALNVAVAKPKTQDNNRRENRENFGNRKNF
jgi:RNA recognition motif-containing protein